MHASVVSARVLDIARLLEMPENQEVRSSLTDLGQVSVLVADSGGEVLHRAPHDRDRIFSWLLANPRFPAHVLGPEPLTGAPRRLSQRGLVFIATPAALEGHGDVVFFAGPMREGTLPESCATELAQELGQDPAAVDKAVSCLPEATPDREALVRALSQTCARVALHVSMRHDALERSNARLAAILEIANAVSSSLELEKVLETVLQSATSLLNAQAGSLMLLNDEGTELRILTAVGLPEQIVRDTRVPVGTGISGKVAQEGKARLLLKGVRESSSLVDKKAQDIKSAICVPLKARDEVLGVLNVSGKKDGGDFSQAEMELLEILGSSVAFAIHNATLYERINRSAQQLSALFEIGNAINSSLERDTVLQEVLDRAIHLLNARKGSLMLLEEGGQELRIVVAHGLPTEIIATVRVPLGSGIAGGVAQEGKPRLLLRGERASDSGSAGKGGGFPSAISVPINIKERLIGVLNISDRATEDNFTDEDVELLMMMGNQAAIALENARLMADLHELFVSSIKALANAIDARDPYTRGHSERVTEYSVRIAQALGIASQEIEFLRYAALLHDIGKINIPDHILNKPGKLTDEEFAIMQRHPAYGAQIMEPVKAFHHILPYMYHHHEKYAAGGYPSGKSGEEVPLAARIISVADAFDAMTSDRPYRKGFACEKALDELRRNSGIQFDPHVVDLFVHLVETDESCRPEYWIKSEPASPGETPA